MTPAQVNELVEAVRAQANDPEVAHTMEDALWMDVLHAIANGAGEPGLLAAAALRTTQVGFPRWCA